MRLSIGRMSNAPSIYLISYRRQNIEATRPRTEVSNRARISAPSIPPDISPLELGPSKSPRLREPSIALPSYWNLSSLSTPNSYTLLFTMMSLRNLARSAPRSAARFSTKAVRPQSSLRQAFQPAAWAAPIPRLTASFSMSAARREDSGSTH